MQVARGANGCGGHGSFNTAQCPQMQKRFSFSTIVQIHFCVALAKWKLAKMHKYANSSHYKYLHTGSQKQHRELIYTMHAKVSMPYIYSCDH